jgi:hypothetical protein
LFYRTLNGAQVGDLFMSLIHTAELCGANSFDYLTELQRHAQELAVNPAEWMPWNYRESIGARPTERGARDISQDVNVNVRARKDRVQAT